VGLEEVKVVYVSKRDAKLVKSHLEAKGKLNKSFRMLPATSSERKDCIAIPYLREESAPEFIENLDSALVLGFGTQLCPYSSAVLGSNRQARVSSDKSAPTLTLVQQALWGALIDEKTLATKEEILQRILTLNRTICPRKLELVGDDNTVVLPKKTALDANEDTFKDFLTQCGIQNTSEFSRRLWEALASRFESSRVVRKGKVDPESSVRESGVVLLWPFDGVSTETGTSHASRLLYIMGFPIDKLLPTVYRSQARARQDG
jgi:hypothetical protein